MRAILLKSCFLVLAPSMMHGMDPKSTKKTKPRSSTDPNIVSPLIHSDESRSLSPSPSLSPRGRGREHTTRPELTEKKFLKPSSNRSSGEDRKSRDYSKDKPRKLLSASPSKKSTDFSFDKLRSDIQQNKNLILLQKFLTNPNNNPNIQNEHGNTLLHSAVFLRKKPAIEMLVQDPRINSLIPNNESKTAFNYSFKAASEEVHEILRLRANLDHILYAFLVTNKICFEEPLRKKEIRAAIKNLLLQHTGIPTYANPEIASSMIQYRLDYNRATLEKDYKEFNTSSNYQGIYGDTLVHLATYLHDFTTLNQLIKNPVIWFNVKNNDGNVPQALLASRENEIIRQNIFMRTSLEDWTCAATEKISPDYLTIDISNLSALTVKDPLVQKIIEHVKLQAEKIKESQITSEDETNQDRRLPSAASDIPLYAMDEFFLALIKSQLLRINQPNCQKISFNINDTTVSDNEETKQALKSIQMTVVKDIVKTDIVGSELYQKFCEYLLTNVLPQVEQQVPVEAQKKEVILEKQGVTLQKQDLEELTKKVMEELAIMAIRGLFKKDQQSLDFPQ